MAKFATNNWHNTTINITSNNNNKSNNNYTNINLIEFEIYTKYIVNKQY